MTSIAPTPYDFAQQFRGKGYGTYDGITDPELRELPDGLNLKGLAIAFTNCSSLTSFPKNFTAGYLRLTGNTPIRTLPSDIQIGGYVTLKKLSHFEYLPEGLIYKDALTVDNCPSFRSLSSGVLGVTSDTYVQLVSPRTLMFRLLNAPA